MSVFAIDHIVLCVADVQQTLTFYENNLGLQPKEERPGKWSLHFGANKISLQSVDNVPDIARGTTPGSGNYCLVADTPVDAFLKRLEAAGIEILEGPVERIGAVGTIRSIYFNDPDGNLVEVCNHANG